MIAFMRYCRHHFVRFVKDDIFHNKGCVLLEPSVIVVSVVVVSLAVAVSVAAAVS